MIKFDSENDGASTLNINALGAVSIFKNTIIPLSSGDIKTDQEIIIVYDGTNFQAIGLVSSQLIAYVHNAEGAVINKGQVVYAYQATGNKMSVKLARADSDATSAKTIGLVYDTNIGIGADGYIIIQGVIEGINTGAFSAGDTLYLDGTTFGAVTNVKPYAPIHLVYVGIVERANPGNGQIYVRCQNGYELDEIHDVDLITVPPVTNDVLVYDGVSLLWSGKSIPTILGSQTANTVLAGPSAGVPATPTFRSLVAADIPTLSYISTTLTSANIIVGDGTNTAAAVSMSGDATISNTGVVTLTNTSVTGQAITGYVSGAGTVAATDTILQAIQKLDGNSVFTIHANFASFNPADATTYYFGAQYTVAPGTAATARIFYIPYDCTLIGYTIGISYTVGSAQDSQIYCRINNTTDVQLGGNFSGAATIFTQGTTAATNLSAGDYLNIKWVCPTWVTNPTGATGTVILYLKRR
jgi:hypothetical protein